MAEDPKTLPAASRFSILRYGQRSYLQETDVTIAAATITQLVGNTPDRLSLLISNSGTSNTLTVSSKLNVSATLGTILGASGGSIAFDALGDGEGVANAQFGFSTAGTTAHIVEIIGTGPIIGDQPLAILG